MEKFRNEFAKGSVQVRGSLVPIRCGLFIDKSRSEFENSQQNFTTTSGAFRSTTPVTFVTSCDTTKMIIVVAMFSGIRDDGRTYESSNHSDSNEESTTGHENHFLPHPSPSSSHSEFTNFDNMTIPLPYHQRVQRLQWSQDQAILLR